MPVKVTGVPGSNVRPFCGAVMGYYVGRWRFPALAFCTLAVGAFLALPAGVLGYWLVRGLQHDRDLGFPWAQTIDSLTASALAAGIATAIP